MIYFDFDFDLFNSKTYIAFHAHSMSQALNSTTAAPGGTDIGTVSGAAATALQVLRSMFVNVVMDRYIGFNMNQWIVPIRGQICVSNKYKYIYTYISVELLLYLHLYICSLQRWSFLSHTCMCVWKPQHTDTTRTTTTRWQWQQQRPWQRQIIPAYNPNSVSFHVSSW